MSIPSVSTSANQTWQCSDRVRDVDMVIFHHAAMTDLGGLVNLMHGAREVSAHFAIKDDQIISTVAPEKAAWSLANRYWDSRAITAEACNSAVGDDSGWPLSDRTHISLARVALWAHYEYGVPLDRDHIIGHREAAAMGGSYSTACPGGMDLDLIVSLANQMKNGSIPYNEGEDELNNEEKQALAWLHSRRELFDKLFYAILNEKGFVNTQLDNIAADTHASHIADDIAVWALTDPKAGLRKMNAEQIQLLKAAAENELKNRNEGIVNG